LLPAGERERNFSRRRTDDVEEMSEENDERMQVEAAQRDPSRFARLYEKNFYRVYAYIVRRVSDRHQAEDLTADVFREALAGIGKFEWRGVPFASWLMGIASRVVADHWKRAGRESGSPTRDAETVVATEIEHSTMLFQLVGRLPAAQLRVIHMRFVEQKSIREIAHEIGRSEGAVKQLQLRALETLRADMEGTDV
jgi:RNA polymerase sigma-70 factor (ECF subfamily)